MADGGLIRLGGLWKSTRQDGTEFLSGNLGNDARLLVFKNKARQEGSNQPDYAVFLAARERDKDKPAAKPKTDAPIPESDIPF